MTLTLTGPERHVLADAIRTLASPVAPASGWLADALGAMAAVGGETSVYVAPPAVTGRMGAFDLGSPSFAPDALSEYERYFPYLVEIGALDRCVRQRVVSRRQAYGDRYKEVAGSEYTHDFLRLHRSFDAVTMTVPLTARPRTHRDVVQLAFVSRDPARAFEDRHVGLAQLLYPAFEAGVGALRALAGARSRLRTALDAGGAACWVADRDGRRCHQTPALAALLTGEPDRADLAALAARIGRSFWGDAPTAQARFAGRGGRYRLTATEVRDGHERFVVVRVERAEAGRIDPAGLGLTRRQSEVALLLAERRTNKEIAGALSVSVHTARHHVGAVLAALGVRRDEVARALREAAPSTAGSP